MVGAVVVGLGVVVDAVVTFVVVLAGVVLTVGCVEDSVEGPAEIVTTFGFSVFSAVTGEYAVLNRGKSPRRGLAVLRVLGRVGGATVVVTVVVAVVSAVVTVVVAVSIGVVGVSG